MANLLRAYARSTIIIIDLGGDLALFNFAKAIAAKNGRKFRWFSTDHRKSSAFDLLQGLAYGMTQIQASNMFVTGTGHGGVFGKHGSQYFAGQAMFQTVLFIEWVVSKLDQGRSVSIKDVDTYLDDPQNQVKDANQIRATIKQLAAYVQLTAGANNPDSIDLYRAVKEKEVIYFFLGTLGEEETCRAIASIVIETLVAVMKFIGENIPEEDRCKPKDHCFLLLDETQEVAHVLHGLLSQARKHGISCIAAHQTSSQMKNVDQALLDVTRDNTSTKMYLSCTTEDDVREIQGYSKLGIDHRRSFNRGGGFIASGGGNRASESESEFQTPLTDRSRILDASANVGELYLITDQDGHREPIRTRVPYSTSKAEYLRALTTPLPLVGEKTAVAGSQSPQLENQEPQWKQLHRQQPGKKRAEHLERVSSILQMIRGE
ncbi:MAG: type IV secretory system conjugative DNA transfer family protein [Pseudomonadota bacterium]